MELEYTTLQHERRAEARRLFGSVSAPSTLATAGADDPGYDDDLWATVLRSQLFTPDSLVDLVVVCEELGRSAVAVPAHNGLIQCDAVLRELGASGHRGDLLGGAHRYALCITEPEGSVHPDRIRLQASRRGGDWVLDGTKCFIPYGGSADVLLVVARTSADAGDGGLTLFAVDARTSGVVTTSLDSIGGDRQGAITFADVRVADADRLTDVGAAWPAIGRALDRGVIALCSDMVGAADAALEHTVERVAGRQQWGVPIGSFQAVQHRCADMLIDVTLGRDAVLDAASAIDRGEDSRLHAALTKSLCAEACRRVSASAHQLNGGQGIYADRPLHVWFRRIKSMAPMLGDARWHREIIAAHVLDGNDWAPAPA